jgi:hypothetical protein
MQRVAQGVSTRDIMRWTTTCRWRSILVELPIGMSLLWNRDAVKTSVPRLQMDPVHSALHQLVTKVSREYNRHHEYVHMSVVLFEACV